MRLKPILAALALLATLLVPAPAGAHSVPRGGDDGCMGYRHMVSEVFPGEVNYACQVMWCESRGDAGARSSTNDHGLLQINAPTWNRPGHSDPVAHFIGSHWHLIYDPWSNLVMAEKIRSKYGWRMWSCA